MKPVAILRHSPGEGAGYFATFLDAHGIGWQLICLDEGDPVPTDPSLFSGICFMGGPMSVNDPIPWIAQELALIRHAVRRDVPTIGHCLGGQLMSKALGGTVGRNPVKEIGWGEVTVVDGTPARDWLGETKAFLAYHWHGETFTLPTGAEHLLTSAHCENQAFVLGRHIGMQCHVEMTADMIRSWVKAWPDETRGRASVSVQTPVEMLADLDQRVDALNRIAVRIYTRWVRGLVQ